MAPSSWHYVEIIIYFPAIHIELNASQAEQSQAIVHALQHADSMTAVQTQWFWIDTVRFIV